MKKTALAAGIALSLGTVGANAAFTPLTDNLAGNFYRMNITGGCFTFGNCQTDGTGVFADNTASQTTFGGPTANSTTNVTVGSGIAGDGIMGVIDFTVSGGGSTFAVTSFAQDSFLATSGGTFFLDDIDNNGANMALSIANTTNNGAMTLQPTGRNGLALAFATSLGEQPWNLDTAGTASSGVFDTLTTGTSTNRNKGTSASFSVTGSALVDAGAGMWTGTLATAGNIGTDWGGFKNTQISEIWNVSISQVPVPAAVWLFGSGLVGLVGVARRKKKV